MKTGLVYSPICLEHDTGMHVENSQRLIRTIALINDSGLDKELTWLTPRHVDASDITTIHTPDYVTRIRLESERGGGWLDADTFLSPMSYRAAVTAVGSVFAAVESVMEGKISNGFALVRPPGHHAKRDRAMGFCIFNNIALGACHLLSKYEKVKKVAIVDFDVHHGNGTQDFFYDDPRVLYVSTHQFPLYPGTGTVDETGGSNAEGTKVNIPLPPGCGDEEYEIVFEDIVVPVISRFQPDFILVSSGYDTHWAESLASMQMTVTGFAKLTGLLRSAAENLCSGRLVFSLEGGYNLEALAYSIQATVNVLLGKDKVKDPLGFQGKIRKPSGLPDYLIKLRKLHHL
jgi:acetoin utilization deacetylase AcuC-like enzyme